MRVWNYLMLPSVLWWSQCVLVLPSLWLPATLSASSARPMRSDATTTKRAFFSVRGVHHAAVDGLPAPTASCSAIAAHSYHSFQSKPDISRKYIRTVVIQPASSNMIQHAIPVPQFPAASESPQVDAPACWPIMRMWLISRRGAVRRGAGAYPTQ